MRGWVSSLPTSEPAPFRTRAPRSAWRRNIGPSPDYLDGGERELIGQYTEVESGLRCGRPALARALDACRRQQATLIVAGLDRLAREASVLSTIFDCAADCEVVFCDVHPSAPEVAGKFRIARLADGADVEAEPWRRTTRAAWATQSASGRWPGWAASTSQDRPETRRRNSVARRLADQRAARTLPIVRAIQASGIGTLQGLADALNARGVPTARGARWYPTTVRNLLGRDVRGSQQGPA
jgi:DNA invertase Pin-like site-specific DNA recombinase